MGVEIERNITKCLMSLSQKKYLTEVLDTYKMLNSKPIQTLIATHFKLSKLQCLKTYDKKSEMENVLYANAVECLSIQWC